MVLISTQHDETVTNDEIAAALKKHVIKPVILDKYLGEKTIFHLNPSGHFVIGGPHGDAGITGRKIITGRTLLGLGFRSSSGRVRLLVLSLPKMADPPFPNEESQTIWCLLFSVTETEEDRRQGRRGLVPSYVRVQEMQQPLSPLAAMDPTLKKHKVDENGVATFESTSQLTPNDTYEILEPVITTEQLLEILRNTAIRHHRRHRCLSQYHRR
ncbi:hypothetical protein MRB53_010063 [Persea americana]|uniref:Uncharacterized protein n=1 Tax=Persea americana TaxID=3435 RepID=A0ACC2LRY7_PERAE|nr:hypothetical protein MRB53_010063 [Persea americana]